MEASAGRKGYSRPNRYRTPNGSHSGVTKFDRWLKNQADKKAILTAIIAEPSPYSGQGTEYKVRVLEVDRYMVCLEFITYVDDEDKASWWVAKDSIRAVSRA